MIAVILATFPRPFVYIKLCMQSIIDTTDIPDTLYICRAWDIMRRCCPGRQRLRRASAHSAACCRSMRTAGALQRVDHTHEVFLFSVGRLIVIVADPLDIVFHVLSSFPCVKIGRVV